MAKGFKFPAPKGFAKGGMCSPKGAKGYAKGGYAKGGGPIKGTNVEASDLYSDSDLKSVEAGRNVPMANKNRMRSESVQNAKAKADLKKNYDDMYSFNPKRMMDSDVGGAYTRMRATEDQTGEYAKGGKVAMKKMKSGRTFAKIKKGYADGGEVETEQMASKSTKVKMPRGAKAPMPRAKSVPVASRQPMIQPRTSMASAAPAVSPLARIAAMKKGGKAVKGYANGGVAMGRPLPGADPLIPGNRPLPGADPLIPGSGPLPGADPLIPGRNPVRSPIGGKSPVKPQLMPSPGIGRGGMRTQIKPSSFGGPASGTRPAPMTQPPLSGGGSVGMKMGGKAKKR